MAHALRRPRQRGGGLVVAFDGDELDSGKAPNTDTTIGAAAVIARAVAAGSSYSERGGWWSAPWGGG